MVFPVTSDSVEVMDENGKTITAQVSGTPSENDVERIDVLGICLAGSPR